MSSARKNVALMGISSQQESVSRAPAASASSRATLRYLPALAVLSLAISCGMLYGPDSTTWRDLVQSSYETIFPENMDAFGPAFIVQDLPGRGKGAIAARNIQQGELLIRERPLVLLPSQITTSPTQLVLDAVRGLSYDDSAAFYNLSAVHVPENLSPEELAARLPLAIFQTNAVAAGSNVGLFPTMARLNHGCSHAFNSVYSWRESDGVLVVHALKKIKKGDELLTAYFDTRRSRNERRQHLKQVYDFHCMCASCALPEDKSKVSDERLGTMSELYRKLSTWGEGNIDGREAIRLVRRIWTVGDAERYTSERGRLAADAALVAAAHSDADALVKWAQLGLRWAAYELGADSELAAEMRSALDRPSEHPMWGKQAKMDVGGPGRLFAP